MSVSATTPKIVVAEPASWTGPAAGSWSRLQSTVVHVQDAVCYRQRFAAVRGHDERSPTFAHQLVE